jgi:hypothetical protein
LGISKLALESVVEGVNFPPKAPVENVISEADFFSKAASAE